MARIQMQDVVDSLEGPTDCDVARPSIATEQIHNFVARAGWSKRALANSGLVGMSQWLTVAIGWA